MEAPASLGWITIDCDERGRPGKFYREALGWEIIFSEGPYSGISDGTITIEFNAVEGYQRPQVARHWRGGNSSTSNSWSMTSTRRPLKLRPGAAQPQFQPGGERFRVLTDPAGHPFCIIDRAVAGAD